MSERVPRRLPVLGTSDLDRRDMLKLLAAGTALATGSLGGCMSEPSERIMPRVEQPPELTPGVPAEYATAMVIDGYATGLVAKAYEARPTKLEGNPDHPASLGATTAIHQASILELYDPHRSKGPHRRGQPISRDQLVHEIAKRDRIPGLWFLLHPQSSPVLETLMARVRERHPGARFAFYSPLERRNVFEAARRVFGRPLEAQYRFDQADTVVALDADFTAAMPGSLRWARDFATRRRPQWPLTEMSRLYVAEQRPTPTGSIADHRLAVRASAIHSIAAGLLAALRGDAVPAMLSRSEQQWIAAAAADLQAHRGRACVIAGDRQPPEVHVIAHAINQHIGALGGVVTMTATSLIEPLGDGLAELALALMTGTAKTVVIADANPVYSAARDYPLATLLPLVPESICAALDENETSRCCTTFVPLSHYLESWSDGRAYDGTISFTQPLLRPMYDSIGLLELIAAFAGDAFPSAHDMLLARYGSDALTWPRLLQQGFVPGTASPALDVTVAADAPAVSQALAVAPRATGIDVAFDASHAVYDGRYSPIAWLQELPKPHDKLTWGNAAWLGTETAHELGVTTGEVVTIAAADRQLELPAYVMPGHAENCVSLELGYGRWVAGPVGSGVGYNAFALRQRSALGAAPARVTATGRHKKLAATQTHFDQLGREIALAATADAYRANPDFTKPHRADPESMLPAAFAGVPAWGMTIDTAICTGCSACVVACQAENNVPVVGRQGVIDSRAMHWLRIDTYREVRGDAVEVVHQPMLCQHCENAPCEYVCPTYATQHSPDGLNEMIYNRCIGTRFCSNNCPYKVRRFNWFDYTEDTPKTERLQRNPNVTVRARGVMEKCTFCVQRIRGAEIAARKGKRDIRPNEVATACQQACPTGAIKFGLLSHDGTEMVELRKQPRLYFVLNELGTRPRTAYLAKITNPRKT
ncbi:MAG TPA: 4Fe-4S dicluster domain-containing protein [Kofleriaceae bacterium]|nr:4Fe-4S dicluster domain-containing protein [Kofleriaceae bacterium]